MDRREIRRSGPAKPVIEPRTEFERLLRPLIPMLYRHAFRWTTTRDQAEDLVQDLLVKLYPRCAELAALDRLQPWALRVMYRIFVDQHRRAANSPVRPFHEVAAPGAEDASRMEDLFPDDSPQPPDLVERALDQQWLARAWGQLGEDHRVVVAMHDIEGYGLEELSAILEVPVGTLKSRLHRARARLRELLATEPGGASVRVEIDDDTP
jgi:RNA polymerase sigma factor (sigma-70 family)